MTGRLTPPGGRCAWALAGAVMIAAPAGLWPTTLWADGPGGASAQAGREPASAPSQPDPAGRVLTGKERLSDKASDDQRVDNCKVPPEERGPKPRPASCGHHKNGVR